MGLAFKENCPDIRNIQIEDLVNVLAEYYTNVDVYYPWVDKIVTLEEFNLSLIEKPEEDKYDSIIIALSYDEFRKHLTALWIAL